MVINLLQKLSDFSTVQLLILLVPPFRIHCEQKLPNIVYARIHTQGNNAIRNQEQPKLRNIIL